MPVITGPRLKVNADPLKATWWRDNARVQEAGTVPFRSMIKGRDTGTTALQLLQGAFEQIQGLPTGRGTGTFGPFSIPTEFNRSDERACHFGNQTKQAVELFQRQSGLDVDGMAGIMTMGMMDLVLQAAFGE